MGVRNVADDVLSQGEIDALLTALSSGEMDAEELKVDETENNKIKVYDFKRALRFSKSKNTSGSSIIIKSGLLSISLIT